MNGPVSYQASAISPNSTIVGLSILPRSPTRFCDRKSADVFLVYHETGHRVTVNMTYNWTCMVCCLQFICCFVGESITKEVFWK